jgi:general secretion pathway protein A
LSNFQFGNQALLQSFLVGQPEFREILRRPEMEQFRQRVAAICHIGPLDCNETRGYIEHRLKRAGSTGKPTFDDESFAAVFDAGRGIPRRINSICDRLLLLGFLNDKTHFSPADVHEVVRDFAQEIEVGERSVVVADEAGADDVHRSSDLLASEVDLSRIKLDPETAHRLKQYLEAIGAEQSLSRLQRVEVGVLRLERLSRHMLVTLQKLLGAVEAPSKGETGAVEAPMKGEAP